MTRCGIKLNSRDDFKSMKSAPDKQRRTHFEKDLAGSEIAKRHSHLHPFENQIVSFRGIHRVEELLAQKPPVSSREGLAGANIETTPLHRHRPFAFKEVSKALQNTQFIPVSDELLFWKDGNLIGSVLTPSRIVLDKARPLRFSQDSRREFLHPRPSKDWKIIHRRAARVSYPRSH
ncbi:hypothetical protein M405DRAFT_939235 [Rhizopogon salebrosus TDB-379]|nr:hypothetical protein M405DRAFT_939235 [Rhizopogon salebrosus TDB-379]